jgi:hypothetical protein
MTKNLDDRDLHDISGGRLFNRAPTGAGGDSLPRLDLTPVDDGGGTIPPDTTGTGDTDGYNSSS